MSRSALEFDFPYSEQIETVRDGFVTPSGIRREQGEISGCVYRSDGTRVDLSERAGGYRGDKLRTVNPDRIAKPTQVRHLAGRSAYLGHFMAGHYGHFIFENVATFWLFQERSVEDFDHFVFNRFMFGERVPDYARLAFDRLGIDPDRIVIVGDEAVSFDELVVPERLARLNHSSHPRLRWVYETIAGDAIRSDPSRRIYVSRRLFNAKMRHRVVANEVRIEHVFREAGFDIVYPEAIGFREQLGLCGDAAAIAGLSGSNLLNVLFAPRNTLLIELGDPRYKGEPNPCIPPSVAVSGARHRFVPFAGKMFGPRKSILNDMNSLVDALNPILQADLAPARIVAAPPRIGVQDALEIAYRSLRPSLGHYATEVRKAVTGSAGRSRRPSER